MAIRSYPWLDGFDYYATDRLTYKWASASNIHVSPTGGRRNSGCITPTGAGYLVSNTLEIYNNYSEEYEPITYLSVAFAVIRQTADAFKVIAESSGNTAEFEFEFTCSGRIGCRQTGGAWYYTDGIVPMGEWCHVWLHISAFGPWAIIVALDSHGNTLIDDFIPGDEIGMTFDGSPLFSSFRIESAACGNWRIDDLYAHYKFFKNAYLGDCRVDALEMTEDDPSSDYANWTFSSIEDFAYTVSTRAENVTSNATTTAFACVTDMLPHTPVSVLAVQSNVWSEYVDSDTAFALTVGTLESTPINALATETGWTYSWADNNGVPWTVETVNAATFGVKLNG